MQAPKWPKSAGERPLDEPLEGECHGRFPDCRPVPRKATGNRFNAAGPGGPGEPDEPDRLVGRASGGTRDAGDRDRDVRVAAIERAGGHLADGRLAHGAKPRQRLFANAEELDLGVVRISDEAAIEPLRAARDIGDRASDKAARARLRGRGFPAAGSERAPEV